MQQRLRQNLCTISFRFALRRKTRTRISIIETNQRQFSESSNCGWISTNISQWWWYINLEYLWLFDERGFVLNLASQDYFEHWVMSFEQGGSRFVVPKGLLFFVLRLSTMKALVVMWTCSLKKKDFCLLSFVLWLNSL